MVCRNIFLFLAVAGVVLITHVAAASEYVLKIRQVGSTDIVTAICTTVKDRCLAAVSFTMPAEMTTQRSPSDLDIHAGIKIDAEFVNILFLNNNTPVTTQARGNSSFAERLENILDVPKILTLYTINPASSGDQDYAVIRPINNRIGQIVLEVTRRSE